MSNSSPILITGGHMTPALAVINELKQRGHSKFIWVGHKHNQFGSKSLSPEYEAVTKMGIKFLDLKAGKLTRNWGGDPLAGIVNLAKVPWGMLVGLWIIVRRRPQIIVSFGGYIALPLAIAGKLLGKKVVTHEQTAVTGLTNRIIPKFADKVLISWPSSAEFYPRDKTVLTGNPLRPEVFVANTDGIPVDGNVPTIYITGGNQGSHKINVAVFEILPELLKHTNVIHQTGSNSITQDAEKSQELKNSLPEEEKSRYFPQPYFHAHEIGEVFAKTNLYVGRSGANTTYELAALGKPSILIPIPWVTHNEQYRNAKLLADTGIASILDEKNLTGDNLQSQIMNALERISNGKGFGEGNLEQAQGRSKSIVRLDAAEKIVDEIEQLLNG